MPRSAPALAIRRGEQRDIDAVGRLLTETWHHTYDAMMGPEAVARMAEAWHRPEVLSRQLAARQSRFLVAERGPQIVGHAYARMNRPDRLFLARLYVRPDCQRRGIGTELLIHLLPHFSAAQSIELSVVKQNLAAVDFYRRYGFTVTGESVEDGTALLLMQRALDKLPGC